MSFRLRGKRIALTLGAKAGLLLCSPSPCNPRREFLKAHLHFNAVSPILGPAHAGSITLLEQSSKALTL
jgi:hypothetical protein